MARQHNQAHLEALAAQARAGEASALAELWRLALPITRARARPALARLGGATAAFYDADDLLQDLYEQFHRWLMDGGPQEGYDPLQRWAYYLPLALSRVLRRPPLRQRTRPREEALTPSDDEEADFDALAGPCDDPAHAALQAETAAWVQAALRRLPPDEQEALWLRDALGYPVGEAARRLGVEPAALDRCLRSARRRLWQALAALEGG